ncbi:unnamed protein product [Allacma fusca]|uniref:Uncharacterized protein n=1 Tax=Allacma fusca TaxID=39272 RepID=A0A8J2KJQ6_9HEXA|nr:unnamed protein product [Allacma fusca]
MVLFLFVDNKITMDSPFKLQAKFPDLCLDLPSTFPFSFIQKLLQELKETRKDLSATKSLLSKVILGAKTMETLQNQQSSEIFLLKAGFQSNLEETKKLQSISESHSQRLNAITESVKKYEFHLKSTKSLFQETLNDIESTKEDLKVKSCVLEDTQEEVTKLRAELIETNATLRRTANAHENTRNLLQENSIILYESKEELSQYRSEFKSQLQKALEQDKLSKTWRDEFTSMKNDILEVSASLQLSKITQTNSRKMLLEQSGSLKDMSLEVTDVKLKLESALKQYKHQTSEIQNLKEETEIELQRNSEMVQNSKIAVDDLRRDLFDQKTRLNRIKSEFSHQWGSIHSQFQNSHNLSDEIRNLKAGVEKINSIIRISTDEFLKTKWSLTDIVTNLRIDTGNQIYKTEKDLLNMKGNWSVMEANPLPRGFLYTQYAGQLEPRQLWPTVGWQDVTTEYAGLFFRALGGSSRTFGKTQPDGIPRIGTISFGPNEVKNPSMVVHIPQAQGASQTLVAGGNGQGSKFGYQFHVEGSEILYF